MIFNYSDKALHLLTDTDLCKGIMVTNLLITVDEQSFFSRNNSEINMDIKVNRTEFPERKNNLLRILKKHKKAIALEGDNLGRIDAIQHTVLLEPGAKLFFILNYQLPLRMRPPVDKLIEEMKQDR